MLELIKNANWINLFCKKYIDKNGNTQSWEFCSRKKDPNKPQKHADAVVVVPFTAMGEIVLIKQYRPAADDYVIENVAGLIDEDDVTIIDAAKRELKEETGLDIVSTKAFEQKIYNSIGITDETVSYVFCVAEGVINTDQNEDTEDITVLVVNREVAKYLLQSNEKISAKCWLILQAYINGFDWIGSKI